MDELEIEIIADDYKQKKKSETTELMWIEKYRPKKLSKIISQENVVNMMSEIIKTNQLPHLLFYGPPGTGKTSTILALAKELFGKSMRERVLELNASNDRGINVIRNQISMFASQSIKKGDCPNLKLIILDEADAMTSEAQAGLRKIMEQYATNTRFCLICNLIKQIIEPIKSRCAKFCFKPLDTKIIVNQLQKIATIEKLHDKYEDKNIYEQISLISSGDMRKAITILQSSKYLVDAHNRIETTYIYDLIGATEMKEIKRLVSQIKDYSSLIMVSKEICGEGFSVVPFLQQFSVYVTMLPKLSDDKKMRICMEISRTEKKLSDGASEYLQILNVMIAYYQEIKS